MSMPINPNTGSPMLAAGVNEAGALTALRGLAGTPAGAAALRALGFGALVAGGEAVISGGVNAIGSLFGGGMGDTGTNGPLLMQWPAGTRYPRGIVLRAPDKPEKRYRSQGGSLLTSGDVAAVRRVQRAASRARKGRGRRTRQSGGLMMLPPGRMAVCGGCLTAPCACNGK